MDKLKALWGRHRDILSYLFFGVLTTLVNLGCYRLLRGIWPTGLTLGPNSAAQIISIIFAYCTNRKWVFRSETKKMAMLREMLAFFGARAFSFALDLGILFLAVDVFRLPDLPMKLFTNVLVIALNYLFSKFLIFKKRKMDS